MPIVLYDTLTRRKREFQPVDEDCVKVYVCGPTVYAEPHIGNARPSVVFDVLVRLLRWHYPKVRYVRNITDVDDKILASALETGESPKAVAQKYTDVYHSDMDALGVMRPNFEPKVTDNVDGIIEMITRLLDKGHAYEAEGHVLFDVTSYRHYGELSNRDRAEMIAGARVETAPCKRDPADFVLWKPSTLGQIGWESTWGRGRPGWHIECSAMIERHLGGTIDIHGGGIDLIFPHHENECAQSFCAHQKPLANYWMHNGFVNMGDNKMSKSKGNIITVRELKEKVAGEAIRYALLSTHYRQPLNWGDKLLKDSLEALDSLYDAVGRARAARGGKDGANDIKKNLVDKAVLQALKDDINTPQALRELLRLGKEIRRTNDKSELYHLWDLLLASSKMMGLLQTTVELWFGASRGFLHPDLSGMQNFRVDKTKVNTHIEKREQARKRGDYAEADRIRDELDQGGIIVDDTPNGPIWRYGRVGEN